MFLFIHTHIALFHMNMKSGEEPNPFFGLETEYLQNKYFKEHLDMLVCIISYSDSSI